MSRCSRGGADPQMDQQRRFLDGTSAVPAGTSSSGWHCPLQDTQHGKDPPPNSQKVAIKSGLASQPRAEGQLAGAPGVPSFMLTPSQAFVHKQGILAVIHLSSQKASVVAFSPLSEIRAGADVEKRRSL